MNEIHCNWAQCLRYNKISAEGGWAKKKHFYKLLNTLFLHCRDYLIFVVAGESIKGDRGVNLITVEETILLEQVVLVCARKTNGNDNSFSF